MNIVYSQIRNNPWILRDFKAQRHEGINNGLEDGDEEEDEDGVQGLHLVGKEQKVAPQTAIHGHLQQQREWRDKQKVVGNFLFSNK
jgi:hypothetical protein